MVAFLTEGGLGWLPNDGAASIEFIVGIDLGITTVGALKLLDQKGVATRVFNERRKLFHPKAFYFRSEDEVTLMAGSNNLTSGGIASKHELSIEIQRDVSSESIFGDFLGHFEWLKSHDFCRFTDEQFYLNYHPTGLMTKLADRLENQHVSISRPIIASAAFEKGTEVKTLGDFFRLLAKAFPKVERRMGKTVKTHPLKVLNDEKFSPLFKDSVSKVSFRRLKGQSKLTIGGQWYRIPNIVAVNASREPWENTDNRGRLVLQIHFDPDFRSVFLSVVLQYNRRGSSDAGEMPPQVAQRFAKLLEPAKASSNKAQLNLPEFRHWNYKGIILWGKPLLSFVYEIDSLPDDQILRTDLRFLARAVNASSMIG